MAFTQKANQKEFLGEKIAWRKVNQVRQSYTLYLDEKEWYPIVMYFKDFGDTNSYQKDLLEFENLMKTHEKTEALKNFFETRCVNSEDYQNMITLAKDATRVTLKSSGTGIVKDGYQVFFHDGDVGDGEVKFTCEPQKDCVER
jgi:hypothetical protein